MMKSLDIIFFMFVVASPSLCATLDPPMFNVLDYGAIGDGLTDDSKAFMKAWQNVCGESQDMPILLIPRGKRFMLQPLTFQGPCNSSSLNIKIKGTITAPKNVEDWEWPDNNDRKVWIKFSEISGLVINGGGIINGQGYSWWKCFSASKCDRPIALNFLACENLSLKRLTHKNSPKSHIGIASSNGSHISLLHIVAPSESPNTDGIDISGSSNMTIYKSLIQTGDDCIAINGGSTFIKITGVFCGPGHGISIGSLGKNGANEIVENIYVRNCTFKGTTNGARIKTWQGGSGHARNITFEDIILDEANNPVIIDQQYNPRNDESMSAVKVSDVTYRNVRGTSSCEDAIKLNCDQNVACTNIVFDSVNITSSDGDKKIYASCQNAQGTSSSCIPNVPCLSEVF